MYWIEIKQDYDVVKFAFNKMSNVTDLANYIMKYGRDNTILRIYYKVDEADEGEKEEVEE